MVSAGTSSPRAAELRSDPTTAPLPSASFAAFDLLPDAALVADAAGRIEYVNGAFARLLSRNVTEIPGRLLEELVADEDLLHLLGFEATFGTDAGQDAAHLFLRADGERQRLLVNFRRGEGRVFLTLRASGSIEQELANTSRWAAEEQERADVLDAVRGGLVAHNEELLAAKAELEQAHLKLQQEVFARERLEDELRLVQKLESIGQLAAGIAHEINTPMQYIGDNVTFLADVFDGLRLFHKAVWQLAPAGPLSALEAELGLEFLMDQAPLALGSSQEGIKHVSSIVKAMKSFARVDQGEKVASDLNESIRDTLMVAQSEYKNAATVETELGELPPVLCFPSKMNQVVLNLVVNAAHAIADQKRAELGKIRICSRLDGGLAEVTISDDGAGIPEAIRHKIFDQFFTTKAVGRGTGQGLAITRNIVVDVHGGSISFESEVGKGTTFRLRIPVNGTPERATPQA